MDEIDVLGDRPARRGAFGGDLLSRDADPELQAIVVEASRQLGMPMAMVTLVLDHVQRFRASEGLPRELVTVGATDRRVSFCQYVVADEAPLEVRDAALDERMPQYLVRNFGVRAYLGMPVSANDVVVGSLCVLATEPREFSRDDHVRLRALAARATTRLDELAQTTPPADLSLRSIPHALDRLDGALLPVTQAARAGLLAIEGIRPLVELVRHLQSTDAMAPSLAQRMLAVAQQALADAEDAFCEIEASAGDGTTSLRAMERLFTSTPNPSLLAVTLAGRELARTALAVVGDAFIPDGPDRSIAVQQPVATALVSLLFTTLANLAPPSSAGLQVTFEERDGWTALHVASRRASPDVYASVAEALKPHVSSNPLVDVASETDAIVLRFARPPSG